MRGQCAGHLQRRAATVISFFFFPLAVGCTAAAMDSSMCVCVRGGIYSQNTHLRGHCTTSHTDKKNQYARQPQPHEKRRGI